MKIAVNTGGLQVNFADMVKDVKLIYTNVGNTPFLVDFVDPTGENKTTVVPPAGRYTISSNDGNPTGGRLIFSTESGQTYMVVSKVQEDSTVDGVDEKGYLTGTASKDDVTSLQQEVTSLSDTVDEVSSDLSNVKTDVSTLALSKLPYGTLHFNQGKLLVNSWANLPVSLPISLCIEYDVDSWDGLYSSEEVLAFITSRSVIWSNPAQLSGIKLVYDGSLKRLEIALMNPGGENQYARSFSAYFNAGLPGAGLTLPVGRHTIVFCASGEISKGRPSAFAMYLDGVSIGMASAYSSRMISADLTSTSPMAINLIDNYTSSSVSGVSIPIKLSRVRIFNFQMDADGAPYSVADYAVGKLVPPALYDPAAAQRALLALEDYTIARNATTRLVKDISGNAYDATVVESGGSGDTAWTGTVKGSRDSAVAAFVDEIKTQINQANG